MGDVRNVDFERVSRVGAWAVVACAASLCAWLVVQPAWLLWPRPSEIAASVPAGPVAAPGAPVVTVSKWHLFGDPGAETARHGGTTGAPLNLVLRGTLAEADPQRGIAVLAGEGGVEQAWRVGEELPGGTVLVAVYPDRAVLRRNGTELTLSLPVEPAPTAPAATPVAGSSSSRPAAGPASAAATPGAAPAANPGRVDWTAMQRQIAADPAGFARQFSAQPVIENGRMTGVRLAGGDPALMTRLGLKPDDVVTSVNGIALDSPARVTELLANLKSAARLEATVQRGGKPATLSVDLQ